LGKKQENTGNFFSKFFVYTLFLSYLVFVGYRSTDINTIY